MQTPEKSKPKSLAEQIARFWKRPAAADAAKHTDEAVTKVIAKLTKLLGRLRPKK
jgi:hypothetical protein